MKSNPRPPHADLAGRNPEDLEAIALLKRVARDDARGWQPDLSFVAQSRSAENAVRRSRPSGAWRGRRRLGAVVLVTAATVAGVAAGVQVLGSPEKDQTAAASSSSSSSSASPALELPPVTDAGNDFAEAVGPDGVEATQEELEAVDEGTLWDNSAALSLLMETHGLRRSQPGLGGAWPVAATMTLHIWWVDGAVPDELLDAIARDTPEVTVEVHASVTDRPTLAAAIDASGITNVEGVLSASPRNDGAGIVVDYDPTTFNTDPAAVGALQESVGWPIVLVANNETPAM